MSNILLYVGAILIAFEIVGDVGYAATIISLPLTIPLKPLFKTIKQEENRLKKTRYVVLFLILALVILVAAILTSPIIIVYIFVGRPLLSINDLLNWLFQKSFDAWPEIYLPMVRGVLKSRGLNRGYTNTYLLGIIKKKRIPFLALFGVVILTAGFILQLLAG